VAAVDQEEIDALEDLKATNEIITSSFKNDLLISQNNYKALTTDHEQKKTQLIDVLLEKDKLIKELASFKERDGTNGNDTYQKAQSKAIMEAENARNALQEVSKVKSAPGSSAPSKKGGGPWKTISRLSFIPFTPTTQAFRPWPIHRPDQARFDSPDLTLERERSAIGGLPTRLLVLPEIIPLPPPPARVHFTLSKSERDIHR
jgi:hypothetical protein